MTLRDIYILLSKNILPPSSFNIDYTDGKPFVSNIITVNDKTRIHLSKPVLDIPDRCEIKITIKPRILEYLGDEEYDEEIKGDEKIRIITNRIIESIKFFYNNGTTLDKYFDEELPMKNLNITIDSLIKIFNADILGMNYSSDTKCDDFTIFYDYYKWI